MEKEKTGSKNSTAKISIRYTTDYFTTWALLALLKIITKDKKEMWVWYVEEFVEDSYKNGNLLNPKEWLCDKKEDLIK